MDIFRAEKVAQDRMCNARGGKWGDTFLLTYLNGKKVVCKWLDPYMGAFTVVGTKGFLRTSDVPEDADVVFIEE